MIKAVFPLHGADEATGETIKVLLPLTLVARLIDGAGHVQAGERLVVDISRQTVGAGGAGVTTALHWRSDLAAYLVLSGTQNVGVILLDELKGSLNAPQTSARRARACEVALELNGVFLWRKALLDLELGTIWVLSANKDFDYAGATVFVGKRADWALDDVLSFRLKPGPITRGFNLPSKEVEDLKRFTRSETAFTAPKNPMPAPELSEFNLFGSQVLDFLSDASAAA